MSDKELEIRHQFLDEAQDYLDNLENALIGLASGGVNVQAINSAMRSAHSIKGGAGMMGFQLLNQFSHRLEDGLKVLKIQKHAVDINAELEQQLLAAVDCLRRIAASDRQGKAVDPTWLETQAQPLFDQLYDRLGDPQEEDAASILSPEENQDIVPLLFQTEVEGCLERLQGVLDGDRHCLYEETEILAQELGALGEMLQLPAFSQLCNTVYEAIQAQPDQIDAIAPAALAAWRQTQQLVLAGSYSDLPTTLALEIDSLSTNTAGVEPAASGEAAAETWVEEDLVEVDAAPLDRADQAETGLDGVQWDGSELTELAADELETDESFELGEFALEAADTDIDEPGIALDVADQSWAEAIAQAELAGEGDLFDSWTESENGSPMPLDWPDEALNREALEEPDAEADEPSPEVEHLAPIDSIDSVFLDAEAEISSADVPGVAENSIDLSSADLSAEVGHSSPAINAANQAETVLEPFDSGFAPGAAVDDSGIAEHRNGASSRRSKMFEAAPGAEADGGATTVRVPLRQLKQLNNLFGELTIERNGLELYLKRLRDLLSVLRGRVKTLDQTNLSLRSAYDRVTTRAELEQAALGISSQPLVSQRKKSSTENLTEDFDALELDQYSDMHLMSQEVMETIVQIQEVTTDLELSMDDTDQTFRGLNKTARQLQNRLTQLQMRPLSDILERFPNALRKMSLEHGKSVELKVHGGNILIDRNILEALNEPLLHVLRNAFDHGIEDPDTRQANGKSPQGLIEISAVHRNNRTLISIRDDGKGIDLDKIRARARQMGLDDTLLAAASDDELISLIFEPGFSTSTNVTELSGRGVGMDVVRDSIKQMQGDISVDTALNQGTTFTLSLPFTLSVTRVLLVESNDLMMAFPTDAVEEMTSIAAGQVLKTVGGEVIEWEDQMVQFIRLHQCLQFNCPRSLERPNRAANIEESTVLMVNHNEHLVGLQVGRCWGEQEVAIRYVEGNLPMPPGFSNCTILGDGRVVPMLNVSELLRWIMSDERSRPSARSQSQSQSTHQLPAGQPPASLPPAQPPVSFEPKSHKPAILIVDDSINVRRFLALTLEKAGYRVEQAKDGQDAVDKLAAGLPVQAVICDIEMPRLDGYGVLARVKANPTLAHLPIAMLTSRSGDKHRKLAMSLGASAYFSKPYNEQVLLQTLRQIVESAIVA
ncbi:MAG: response regulator [Elainellaceae cyanobacterium]